MLRILLASSIMKMNLFIIFFFGCCVASVMWRHLSEIFDVNLGADYESVARWWLSNNRHAIMNMTCATLMWSIWKLRNDLCFQGKAWRSEKVLLQSCSVH